MVLVFSVLFVLHKSVFSNLRGGINTGINIPISLHCSESYKEN